MQQPEKNHDIDCPQNWPHMLRGGFFFAAACMRMILPGGWPALHRRHPRLNHRMGRPALKGAAFCKELGSTWVKRFAPCSGTPDIFPKRAEILESQALLNMALTTGNPLIFRSVRIRMSTFGFSPPGGMVYLALGYRW